MIIKTLLADHVPGDKIGTATYVKEEGNKFEFACVCGGSFALCKDNSFRTLRSFRCLRCKDGDQRNEDWGYRWVLKRIKRDAEKRGIEFGLDLDYLKTVIYQDCHYCGTAPMNKIVARSKRGYTLEFTYNGLDRKDSSGGYFPENCVPCCPICNRAKGSVSYAEFSQWVRRMSERVWYGTAAA